MKTHVSVAIVALCQVICVLPAWASDEIPTTRPSRSEPIPFTAVSWNVDSEGADPHMTALRISEFKDVDLWGLCEVRDDHWARLFEQAACGVEPGRFVCILSPTGGSDRSCILYDTTKFDCLGWFEYTWAGLPWYRLELGLRPGLVAHLRCRTGGQEFYFMVNRLCGTPADKQAATLKEWASQQEIPVLAVGTYDFEYAPQLDLSTTERRGYPILTGGGVFQWLMPENPVQTVWRGDIAAIDDFVLLADGKHRLTGRTQVIVEPNDFPDSELTPNHRPVRALMTILPPAR
jgi:hypothetical protein